MRNLFNEFTIPFSNVCVTVDEESLPTRSFAKKRLTLQVQKSDIEKEMIHKFGQFEFSKFFSYINRKNNKDLLERLCEDVESKYWNYDVHAKSSKVKLIEWDDEQAVVQCDMTMYKEN